MQNTSPELGTPPRDADVEMEKQLPESSMDSGNKRKLIRIVLVTILVVLFAGVAFVLLGDDIRDSGDTEMEKDETGVMVDKEDTDNEEVIDNSETATEESQNNQECTKTYSNQYYTDLTFDYDSCYWEVSEVLTNRISNDSKEPTQVKDLKLTLSNDNDTLIFDLKPFFYGDGQAVCQYGEYKELPNVFDGESRSTGRYLNHTTNNWTYSPFVLKYSDEIDYSIESQRPEFYGTDYCADYGFWFSTSFEALDHNSILRNFLSTGPVYYKGNMNNIAKADEVIKTMQSWFDTVNQ